MAELTVEAIQEALKDLLRRQVAAGTSSSSAGTAIAVAKAACRTAGVSEEEVRLTIEDGLRSLIGS